MVSLSILQITLIVIFSGIISVDRLAGLNIMISRPLVVSVVIGVIANDIVTAFMFGLIFEFIGMLEVPVGTTVADDDTFGGYAGAFLAVIGIVPYNAINILATIFFISIVMYPVSYTDKLYRHFNSIFLKKGLKTYTEKTETKLIFLGFIFAFIRGVFVYNLGVVLVLLCVYLFKLIDFNSMSGYEPIIALTIIATFMGGYIIRFLSLNKYIKLLLLSLGFAIGWFFI